MDNDSVKDDDRRVRQNDETSSSSEDENTDVNRASSSTVTFNRQKKSMKRQSCRQQNADIDEVDPGGSSNDDKPSGSNAFNKLHKRVKRRSYRRSVIDSDEASSVTSDETTGDVNADESSASSEIGNNEEHEDCSDEWTSSEEEKCLTPSVLKKTKPKHQLSIVNEVIKRQIGRGIQFQNKLYGSLHMVERLEFLRSLKAHRGCVNTVEFNVKGDLIVSGSDDLAIIVWNWATGKKYKSYSSGHRRNIFQASWLPRADQSYVLTCASDGQVRLLNLPSGASKRLAKHTGPCNKFTIHPELPYVALSVGDDTTVKSIDIREQKSTDVMTMKSRGYTTQIYGIDSSPRNSNEFCICGRSDSVEIYDRRKITKPLMKLCPNDIDNCDNIQVTSVTYNYDGTEILASYNNDNIYLFDTLMPHPNGDYAHKYEGHHNNRTIKGVSYFGPKSEFIVSGSDCGSIYFWEKNTEAIVQCLTGKGVVNCVKPHPYIPMVASCGLEYDVKLWIPAANEPADLSKLAERVMANLNDRNDMQLQLRNRYDVNSFYNMVEHLCDTGELFTFLMNDRSPETPHRGYEDEDDDE